MEDEARGVPPRFSFVVFLARRSEDHELGLFEVQKCQCLAAQAEDAGLEPREISAIREAAKVIRAKYPQWYPENRHSTPPPPSSSHP